MLNLRDGRERQENVVMVSIIRLPVSVRFHVCGGSIDSAPSAGPLQALNFSQSDDEPVATNSSDVAARVIAAK